MRLKKRFKHSKKAGKQSSVVRWGENDTKEDTNNDETDEIETLNAEEEASINNNDTVDASINNEEDDNNMDIADSDDGSNMEEPIYRKHSSSSSESNTNTANSHILPNSIEAPSKPKRLSKSQRNNKNSKSKKTKVRLENERFDGELRSLAWQNVVENNLPFPPMPQACHLKLLQH